MNYKLNIKINLQFISLQTKYLYIIILKSDENWKGLKGFVTLEMITSIFPKLTETTLGVLCGPKPMNKLVISLYE